MKVFTDEKFKAIAAAAARWDALVAAAVESGIANAATLEPVELLQQLTAADSHSDQAAELQQITDTITQRDATIVTLNARIAELEKLPGATPAQVVSETETPDSDNSDPDSAPMTFSDKEDIWSQIKRVGDFVGLKKQFPNA